MFWNCRFFETWVGFGQPGFMVAPDQQAGIQPMKTKLVSRSVHDRQVERLIARIKTERVEPRRLKGVIARADETKAEAERAAFRKGSAIVLRKLYALADPAVEIYLSCLLHKSAKPDARQSEARKIMIARSQNIMSKICRSAHH
jgi:hypothetical protein